MIAPSAGRRCRRGGRGGSGRLSDYRAALLDVAASPLSHALILLLMLLRSFASCNAQRLNGGATDAPRSCDYYTTRLIHIESVPREPLTISVRQNVKGSVMFLEQSQAVSDYATGQITVVVNWTSNSASLLDTVESEWTTVDTISGKMVTIQLDADSPRMAHTSSATLIIGSSVAGGVLVLSIFAVIVVVAIKQRDCRRRSSKQNPAGGTPCVKSSVPDKEIVEMNEYDGTIYPDSIFGTQRDNASRDGSTLNLSLLLTEQGPECQSYRRAASNVSTDQASEYSVPSLPRHPASAITANSLMLHGEQLSELLPLVHSPWRRPYPPYARHLAPELDYTRPSGPIPVLPPRAPPASAGSPYLCRSPAAVTAAAAVQQPSSADNEPDSAAAPTARQQQPSALRLSSFSQLPSSANGAIAVSNRHLASPRMRARGRPPKRRFAFEPVPPSPLSASCSEEEGEEEPRDDATCCSDDPLDTDADRDDDDDDRSSATAHEPTADTDRDVLPPHVTAVLGVPREFMSSEEAAAAHASVAPGLLPTSFKHSRPALPASMLHASFAAITVISVFVGSGLTFCSSKPIASVVFYVPKDANIAAIRLFANKGLQPWFVENEWYLENKDLFQVYDVDDVSLSGNKPCSVRHECPSAANKSLVECDMGSQECVCVRGFKINSRHVCEDVDECRNGGDDVCSPGTSCRNTVGSFDCLCPAGTYWSADRCSECTNGCPQNQYEVKPCTPTSDRVCAACRKCPAGTYTFRPCSAKIDTSCMHISRPNDYSQNEQPAVFIKEKVKLIASPNVFAEDLLPVPPTANGRSVTSFGNLEQTVYVGDNSQRMSFSWQRPSGLLVLVELSEFGLVPQYESIRSATDDNQYLRLLRDDSSQQGAYTAYKDVLENYCSQPVPEYYNIMLMLHKSRLTAVDLVTCNADRKNCPAKYQHGQTYVRRLANRACPKESKVPTAVPDSGNSLLCVEPTALLTNIFPDAAADFAKDEPLHFPPADCIQQMMTCKNCLTDKCQGHFSSCCMASCHGTAACKNTTSAACTSFQTECATGDLAQFILQPNFSRSEFRCHVKRVVPERLVRISYYVTAPNGWNSSRLAVDVPAQSDYMGSTTTAFFSIKYNTSLDAPGDNALLRGQFTGGYGSTSAYSFSILSRRVAPQQPASPRSGVDRSSGAAEDSIRPLSSLYSKNTWMARVQGVRPFVISGPSWRTGHGCDVEVNTPSSPLVVLPLDDEGRRQVDAQWFSAKQVELSAKRLTSGQFVYTVKTPSMSWLRLSLPGNQSILRHLFDRPTVDRKSLTVELVASQTTPDAWELLVAGQVSECGGYVGVAVTDRTAGAEIARYDCIVMCRDRADSGDRSRDRRSFSLRIMIPVPPTAAASVSADSVVGPRNRLLQVDVSDAGGSSSHYVTTYMGGGATPVASSGSEPAAGDTAAALAAGVASGSSRNVDNRGEADEQRTAVYIGAAGLAVAVLASFAYAAAVRLGCLSRGPRLPEAAAVAAPSEGTPTDTEVVVAPTAFLTTESPRQPPSAPRSHSLAAATHGMHCRARSSPRRIALVVMFCLYKLVYSIAFSCTALFFLTMSLNGGSLDVLLSAPAFHQAAIRNVAADLRGASAWSAAEVARQHAAYDERLAACAEYSVGKRRELSVRVVAMMNGAAASKASFEEVKLGSLLSKVTDYRRRTTSLLDSYRRNVTRRVADLSFAYNGLLEDAYSTDWLRIARMHFDSLQKQLQLLPLPEQPFNRSGMAAAGSELFRLDKVAFAGFLGTDRPSSVARRIDGVLRRSDKAIDIIEAHFSESVRLALPDGLRSTAVYRKLLSRPGVAYSPPQLQFKAAELTSPVTSRTLIVFRVALAVIDIVLFLYRFLSAARTLRALVRGGGAGERRESCCTSGGGGSSASAGACRRADHRRLPSEERAIREELDVIRSQLTLTSKRQPALADGRGTETQLTAAPAATVSRAACCPRRGGRGIALALRGPVGCRVAVWLASVAALILTAAALDQLVTRRAVLHAAAIDRLAGSVAAHAWACEAYARSYAAALTRAAGASMRREFNPTLHYQLRHDALHDAEMRWFMRLYQMRRCSVLDYASADCDFDVTTNASLGSPTGAVAAAANPRIDVTPCQALPISATRLPASLFKVNAQTLSSEFRKYSNALREVTLTTVGMVLLFVNLVVILHLAELLAIKVFQACSWTHRLRVIVFEGVAPASEAVDAAVQQAGDGLLTSEDGNKAAAAVTSLPAASNEIYDGRGGSALSPETLSVVSDARSTRSDQRSATLSSVRSAAVRASSGGGRASSRSDDSRRRRPPPPSPLRGERGSFEADLSGTAPRVHAVDRAAPVPPSPSLPAVARLGTSSSSRSSDVSATSGR